MNIDQINQEIENLASNGTGKSGEIKLGHGIYFTDYRKKPAGGGSIKCKIDFCVTKSKGYEIRTNPEVLVADFHELETRIDMLKYSIAEIEGFKDYEKDQVFLEAINEDYDFIIKYYQEQLQVLKQLERVDAQRTICCKHIIQKD